MPKTNMKIVSLVDGELAKSRQQSAQDLAEYLRETRTAFADVRHRLRVVEDMMSQAAEPKP